MVAQALDAVERVQRDDAPTRGEASTTGPTAARGEAAAARGEAAAARGESFFPVISCGGNCFSCNLLWRRLFFLVISCGGDYFLIVFLFFL